ncbi:MAG: ATP-dependent Clp protease proteolytic subunit [Geobacteraceae bacterium]|nr:ATP-dependent Clp protease proteolytic subunit [Geobacteraceae bacterium]
MPQELIKTNTVSVQYHADYAAIRFSGDVNADRVFSLCDEISFAQDYYHYNRVLIEIDSPGGEVKSLQYFVNRLAGWRAKGLVIETLALTSCCSAGAYMLSFGDPGHRAALPDSMLLYHNVRTATGTRALTVESLDSLRWNLSVTDYGMLLKLMRHQYGNILPLELFEQLHELVCCLPDPQCSIQHRLIAPFGSRKLQSRLQQITACKDTKEQMQLRRDLHVMLTDQLRAELHGKKQENAEQLADSLQGRPAAEQHRQQLAWLFGRLEWYQQEFAKDQYIRPEKAVLFQLIDRVERG